MTSLSPRMAESEARGGAPTGVTGSPAEVATLPLVQLFSSMTLAVGEYRISAFLGVQTQRPPPVMPRRVFTALSGKCGSSLGLQLCNE